MPTIKDVAKLADVSATTVSFVMNGKAQERKIPLKTCQRVEEAMNKLKYHPNASARKLRTNAQSKPIIALYWPLDYRVMVLAHLINSIQSELKRSGFLCELIIQTYDSGSLALNSSQLLNCEYDAAIMGGLSEKDLEFLKTVPIGTPVVLINRMLDKLSAVDVNNNLIASMAVSLFLQKGYTKVCAVCSRNIYYATNLRTKLFLKECVENNIDIPDEWYLHTENTAEGGIRAAIRLLAMPQIPKAIFCDSDIIAYGMISHFNRNGVNLPADVELLSVGIMMDHSYTAYCTPSISLIALPHDRIAATAVSLVINMLKFSDTIVQHIEVEPEIILRESFPAP